MARTSCGKTENYLISTQDQWNVELPLLLGDENSDLNGESSILRHLYVFMSIPSLTIFHFMIFGYFSSFRPCEDLSVL